MRSATMLRRLAILLCATGLALASAPSTRADHAHGSGPTTARDTIRLGPAGGGADVATLSLSAIGIIVSSGDLLRYTWYVAIASTASATFQVFAHSETLHLVYVNVTAPQATGQWQVPGSDLYYASFTNPTAKTLNVTYQFDGLPATDATTIVIVGALIMLGLFAFVAVTVRGVLRESRRANKATTAAPLPGEKADDGASPRSPAP